MPHVRAVLVALLFAVQPIHAAIISFDVSGTVTSVQQPTGWIFSPGPFAYLSVGDAITASISYDSDAEYYNGAPYGSGYPVGPIRFSTDSGPGFGPPQAYANFNPASGTAVFTSPGNRYFDRSYFVSLLFAAGGFDGVHPTWIDMSKALGGTMSGHHSELHYTSPAAFTAEVTRVSVVPIPGAAWLFVGALSALAALRRWSSRRSSPTAAAA